MSRRRNQAPRQLIATIGPASASDLGRLVAAGATGLRLNTSHMTVEEIGVAVEAARALRATPVVIDLQGAKLRLGPMAPLSVAAGDRVVFTPDGLDRTVPVPHPELYGAVDAGDCVSLDDDRLRFRVENRGPDRIETRALRDGTILPRKGVNVLDHPVLLTDLSARDGQIVAALGDQPLVEWALSFVRDGAEAEWLRRRLPAAKVIAKIERAEAVAALSRLDVLFDALWLCRGDLGAQLGAFEMARVVAGVDPARLRSPLLMAGQVLEHLTRHREPTRSEVCHLYDLLRRGYSGIVLSDETAIGCDPENAVRQASAILGAVAPEAS
jgi:pyruvate kinase